MFLPVFIALGILGIILVQDVRTRSIWWFLPPLLFGSILWYGWTSFDTYQWLLNVAFIMAMLGFLVVYIRLRFGVAESPFKNYFGWGDFLFLLAITPLLPFPLFVYFFTLGTVFTLIVYGLSRLFSQQTTIPYAGYFSLFTGVYLLVNLFPPISFENWYVQ